ncbi:hypothetical protein Bca4012_084123 [Brassica carinata]
MLEFSPLHPANMRWHRFPIDMAFSLSGKRASRRTRSNYSSSLRRDMKEEKDEKIVPNLLFRFAQCIWTLVEEMKTMNGQIN